MQFVRWFGEIGIGDLGVVGGKNASLGEMIRELTQAGSGIRIPDGFAVTAQGYRHFIGSNDLAAPLAEALEGADYDDSSDLTERTRRIRNLVHSGDYPEDLRREILSSYEELGERVGTESPYVAIRSSATAEDLPTASFAGQQESYLMIHGGAQVLDAVKLAYASLFTTRAVSYRKEMGFGDADVALSVGVQQMVRADTGASGVIFTLDTETGFRDVVLVTAGLGLGENVVKGKIVPDEYYVHKPTLRDGYRPIVGKKLGSKELKLMFDASGQRLQNLTTTAAERSAFCLTDDDLLALAQWAIQIEDHYSGISGRDTPMDIEWAKDGASGDLYVLQARPETVHSQQLGPTVKVYRLGESGPPLVEGLPVGNAIAAGVARLIIDPRDMAQLQPGEILVTQNTDPDWEPVMKRAAAIVTERGGRTSHAAIVARELGIPALVAAVGATTRIPEGGMVTVSTAEGEVGRVYEGELPYEVEEIDPESVPRPETEIMLNVGEPDRAFSLALLPSHGVGLARMEFILTSAVGLHPLALIRYDQLSPSVRRKVDDLTAGYEPRTEYFVDKLALGIGKIAAAFWPRPVILRFSDFKTNEYARLLGGEAFEPEEENPMLGWRGASRYYHPEYRDGFVLEMEAVVRVRNEFGLRNVKVMIPFCRTPEEGVQVLQAMAGAGLERGRDELEVYVMAELPSNVWQANEFADLFDGFSIGSNDLTQLILGVDRDSARVAGLFDERNASVRRACASLIHDAHLKGRPVGICGQAPSDYPEFAAFLVSERIDSISITADALVRTTRRIVEEERKREGSPRAAGSPGTSP